jgi:predicted metalloprotease
VRRLLRPRSALVAVLVAGLTAVAGCTVVVPGQPSALAVSPDDAAVAAPMAAGDPGSAAVIAVEQIWRAEFPEAFGQQWRDIGTVIPVHTDDPRAAEPPCVRSLSDVSGQAFYCPSADAIAWDADGLLPELSDKYGQAGIAVVLAHEIGHAVQSRLGLDAEQAKDPQQYPTILLEAMADCYAGMAVARLSQRSIPGLPMGKVERDQAMLALVGFRDPLGVTPTDAMAHGNAFDRVSAFQDGFTEGAQFCSKMSLENRNFTQRRFGSAADEARGGDLPLNDLLDAVQVDAMKSFSTLVPGFVPPVVTDKTACSAAELAAQGPVRYCPQDGSISIDRADLSAKHRKFGDYASATLLASRYSLATLKADGKPTTGTAASDAALCLTGAYTGRLIDNQNGFTLSPGDLDEAITLLLTDDSAARDSAGKAPTDESGFDRVARFRAGVLSGPQQCLAAA